MNNSAGPGICVHCVKQVSVRNWDHVLPESWYSGTTPEHMEKWKVPSCISCNSKYGKIEQNLLIKFGLCLDPNHPDTKEITSKALRSIKPEYGRNDRDKNAREKKQTEILRQTTTLKKIPSHGILPNFGPEHDAGPEGYICVLLPQKDLEKLTEKIVRGITFIENGIFIDEKYELQMFVLEDRGAQSVIEMINKYGKELKRGPAISIRFATVPEDPRIGLYAIEIWGKAKLYASVSKRHVNGTTE